MNIQVTVKPGAKVQKVVETSDGLIVYLHARAHDGEANTALIQVLADYCDVPKSLIEIIKGEKGCTKLVRVGV